MFFYRVLTWCFFINIHPRFVTQRWCSSRQSQSLERWRDEGSVKIDCHSHSFGTVDRMKRSDNCIIIRVSTDESTYAEYIYIFIIIQYIGLGSDVL